MGHEQVKYIGEEMNLDYSDNSPIVEFTKNWWSNLLKKEDKLNAWLIKLFFNEHIASLRFDNIIDKFNQEISEIDFKLFRNISKDEKHHASLLMVYLAAKNIYLDNTLQLQSKYWPETEKYSTIFELACAVAAYAEVTALIRFRILVNDNQTPKDLKILFETILPDEERHAKILTELAGPKSMQEIRPYHEKGLTNLGIRIKS